MFDCLVLGIGNPLCGDDGFGPRVAEILSGEDLPPGVAVQSHFQLTPEVAEELSQARRVIFIDANLGLPPGEPACERLNGRALPPAAISHSFDPLSLLGFTQALYGTCPEAILLSVGPAQFDLGAGLSPLVAAALPTTLSAARRWMRL